MTTSHGCTTTICLSGYGSLVVFRPRHARRSAFSFSLSLSGTNFSRLWDPQAAKVNFSGVANTVNLFGAAITAGLLGLDADDIIDFFPVNLISAVFMLVAVFHYFCLAVPGYMELEATDPVAVESSTRLPAFKP